MYRSENPSVVVASCIAQRWENVGTSGFTVPVSIAKNENGYFVAVELRAFLDPLIYGLKHPTYAVWAEVTDADSGSTTEYHWAMQLTHGRLDVAVEECQEKN